ncbi:MAG: HEAT repeat domain-containing protein, partial [Pseudomonadota bacterium]|nr:HEAT repeat domain-containing protein [Pseudomonadota bacterium]
AQAARGAPTMAAPWDGPWTLSPGVWVVAGSARTEPTAGAASLARALGLGSVQGLHDGLRPRTRPGEVAVVWIPAGSDLEAASRALAAAPGPQGDLVAVLAPGDAAWAAEAATQLPWAGVSILDPVRSASLWVDASVPVDDALAGRLAASVVADHYGVAYVPAAGVYPPGLDALLGPYDPAMLASADPRTRTEAVRAAARARSATSGGGAGDGAMPRGSRGAGGPPHAGLAGPLRGRAASAPALAGPGAASLAPADSASPSGSPGGALRGDAPPQEDPIDALAADPVVAVRLAVAEHTRDADVRARLSADGDPLVRARAADGLDDVARLDALASDPSSVVRIVATARLGHLAEARPAEVEAPLRRAVASPDAYQRWKAAWGLGRVPGTSDALVPLLEDPDIDVRREAARSLGRLRDPAAVDALLVALRDDNSFVRRWAASALGDIGDPRAKDALRVASKDPTSLAAQAAARALTAMGEPTPAPPFTPPQKPRDDAEIATWVQSPDATVRKDACKFLAERPSAATWLPTLAADRDSEVRKSAVEAMGWSTATAAGAVALVADPDPDVQVTALDALRRAGVGRVAVLAPLLAHRDAEVRLRAAEALGVLGPSDALAALVSDPDERVRAAAIAVYPDRAQPDEPSVLVRRAAGARGAFAGAPDPVAAPADAPLGAWADGVYAHEDDLLHVRFSWNEPADRPTVYRALRPPVVRPYGHPHRG